MKKLFFILFAFNTFLFADNIPYFKEPQSWQIVDPKAYPKHVQIGFVKKTKTSFNPSVNLAKEEISCTKNEYLRAAQRVHTNSITYCQSFGTLNTNIGPADIFEITKQTKFGSLKMLQMILFHENSVYVMTGSCKKEDFLQYLSIFKDCFASFDITNDIFSLLQNKDEKAKIINNYQDFLKKLKTAKNKEKELKNFEKNIQKKFKNISKHFQILLLKKAIENNC